MRKALIIYILSIVTLTSSTGIKAQGPYSKYLDETCVWYEGWYSGLSSDVLNDYVYHTWCITGDTILNGVEYYKRDRKTKYVNFTSTNPYTLVDYSYIQYYDAIREDSLGAVHIVSDYPSPGAGAISLDIGSYMFLCNVGWIEEIFFLGDTLHHYYESYTDTNDNVGLVEGVGILGDLCTWQPIDGFKFIPAFERQGQFIDFALDYPNSWTNISEFLTCDAFNNAIYGCTNLLSCNYNPFAEVDDASCIDAIDIEYYAQLDSSSGEIYISLELTGGLETEYLISGDYSDTVSFFTQVNIGPLACQNNIYLEFMDSICSSSLSLVFDCSMGCKDPTACNYDPDAAISDGSCLFTTTCNTDICLGDVTSIDPNDACSCIIEEVQMLGCTNQQADNYNPDANCDDGSCIISSHIATLETDLINVFPNPSRGMLNIESESEITGLEIHNLEGKLRLSKTYPDSAQDLSHLEAGIYILKLHTSGKTQSRKIVLIE